MLVRNNRENHEKTREILGAELAYGSTYIYMWHLRKYLDYLGENGLDIESVNPAKSVQDYINSKIIEADSPWTKRMANVAFYALKKYWEKVRFTAIERRFFTNRGAESKHEPRILDRAEVQKIWRSVHSKLGETEQAMIHVGWEAALRSGETIAVRWENLSDDGILDVRVLKTRRARKRVSLKPETHKKVMALMYPRAKHIFLKEDKKFNRMRRFTSLEWSLFFHRWTDSVLGKPGIRWHDFARHTRLTHYAEDTRSFMAVLQLSGHQNPKVCRQYFERANITVPELKVIGRQDWEW